MYFQLSICTFIPLTQITQSLSKLLSSERYNLTHLNTSEELKNFVHENKELIDCLIILNDTFSLSVINDFYEQGILLPVIIIDSEKLISNLNNLESPKNFLESPRHLYHSAEIILSLKNLGEITTFIDRSITQFLHLGPSCSLSEKPPTKVIPSKVEDKQNFLLLQQRRLAEKLKERLGYLGVYYNRNSKYFYRYLSEEEKSELLKELAQEYKEIILSYFNKDVDVNPEIDQFVNRIFFVDVSVSQILEIHMELMDAFSQKLKLEGRSEEILLDYRLALIDIIAHLCEMYRRSIPREDLPFDV